MSFINRRHIIAVLSSIMATILILNSSALAVDPNYTGPITLDNVATREALFAFEKDHFVLNDGKDWYSFEDFQGDSSLFEEYQGTSESRTSIKAVKYIGAVPDNGDEITLSSGFELKYKNIFKDEQGNLYDYNIKVDNIKLRSFDDDKYDVYLFFGKHDYYEHVARDWDLLFRIGAKQDVNVTITKAGSGEIVAKDLEIYVKDIDVVAQDTKDADYGEGFTFLNGYDQTMRVFSPESKIEFSNNNKTVKSFDINHRWADDDPNNDTIDLIVASNFAFQWQGVNAGSKINLRLNPHQYKFTGDSGVETVNSETKVGHKWDKTQIIKIKKGYQISSVTINGVPLTPAQVKQANKNGQLLISEITKDTHVDVKTKKAISPPNTGSGNLSSIGIVLALSVISLIGYKGILINKKA